ncbi:polysaccharide deacetylase family protein [Paenibacillus sp. GCM10023252]|uniref:polysaccharide deacetylase family protein n=1 Tax=Paenibacillus sp. GCM10023252 TaxID=3252649 RepID=UPI0036230C38
MMENLLLWGFYLLTFYAFLPGLISRTFGFRVFKKGKVEREIALTFDDGPDPIYTPQLLDLLARYDAKATFFVVGSHAESHPELLKRMAEEGHRIGIHNYVHKSNWLMRPSTVKRQIERTSDIIERATGIQAAYYRPPWGIVNVFDYSNLGYLQIILWSAMFGDWRSKVGTKRLSKRMMRKLKPGEVLLLHDCGLTLGADEDAPKHMLQALGRYLEAGRERGYRFVGIDEMMKLTDQYREKQPKLWKRMLIGLWLLYEKAFHLVFAMKKVGEHEPAFHYRITTYQGDTLQLAEGGSLARGDQIVELHFDNKKLSGIAAQSSSPVATGIRMLREVERALPVLAEQLKEDPASKEARAVYGVTMIHRGADRLGFEIFQLPDGWFKKLTGVYLRILLKVLSPGKRSSRGQERRNTVTPRMLIMPMGRVRQYLPLVPAAVQDGALSLGEGSQRAVHSASEDSALGRSSAY